jgi:hypothetical protein
MSTSKKKSQCFFLSKNDEKSFEDQLKLHFQNIRFIDGVRWPSPTPPAKHSISDCSSNTVFLWENELVPILPFKPLESGLFQGPSSGVVIQFSRCRLKDGILESGDIGIGYNASNKGIADFVAGVWKCLKKLNIAHLDYVNRSTNEILDRDIKNYIVGEDARKLSVNGVLLCRGRTDFFYRIHEEEK